MNLFIIRHGETEFNKENKIQGHTDTELSEKGREQAEKLTNLLSQKKIDKIYCSDLKRCRQTIAPLLEKNKIPVVYTEELRERCYGTFEGKTKEEFLKYMGVDNFTADYKYPIPEGESFKEIQARVAGLLDKIIKKEPGNVLISTHGGTKVVMLLTLFKKDPAKRHSGFSTKNASLSIINFENETPKIELLNSIEHLEGVK